jgi:hypothetical protein
LCEIRRRGWWTIRNGSCAAQRPSGNSTGASIREERRKEEVVKVYKGLSELAKRREEVTHFPPW